jgi:hypothetical protein
MFFFLWRFFFSTSSCLLSSSVAVPFSCPTFLSFFLVIIFARFWRRAGILAKFLRNRHAAWTSSVNITL